jgi:hypothetical protein
LLGFFRSASIPIVGAMYGLPPKLSTIWASSDALRLAVIATVKPLSDSLDHPILSFRIVLNII